MSIQGARTWPVPSQQKGTGPANSLNAQTANTEGVFTADFHTKASAFLEAVPHNMTPLSDSAVQVRAGHAKGNKVQTAALKLHWVLIKPPPE